MAATYVAHTVFSMNGTATGGASHNLTSGNALVLMYASREGGEASISSTTWNAGSVSPQEASGVTINLGIGGMAAVYTGLSAGNFAFSVTLNAAPVFANCVLVEYSGADTSDTIGDIDFVNGVTSPLAATSTTDTNALILTMFYGRSAIASIAPVIQGGNGQTEIIAPTDNINGNCYALSRRTGSTSAQSGYTFTDGGFPSVQVFAVALKGTGGGGSTAHIPAYLQMLRSNQ